MKVFLATDHAGVEIKNKLLKALKEVYPNDEFNDLGTYSNESVHYPEYAKKLCKEILENKGSTGILICGTGIGVSIAANKFKGIRAALCGSEEEGKLARQHNNANVICMGARTRTLDEMVTIYKSFQSEKFEGSRHQVRVDMMDQYGSDVS